MLGLRRERLAVEFTQHTSDEMYRHGRGWEIWRNAQSCDLRAAKNLGPRTWSEDRMTARYLEDFALGQTYGSGRIRIDSDRIKSFAAEFDPQPFHLDEETA